MFVPRLMDEDNLNAQNKNAQLILRHWGASDLCITTLAYDSPERLVAARKNTEIILLWRKHWFRVHLFLQYLRHYDLVFYPGIHAADTAGLRWRKRLGLVSPVVSTLEGLVGDKEREKEYAKWAGHAVFCQHVSPEELRRADDILQSADHVIAISPFLAEMGKRRFGDKFSVLPLGIDMSLFYSQNRPENRKLKVVSAGGLKANKRPELFLELARRYPQADFTWYGEGDIRSALRIQVAQLGLNNLSFPGSLSPRLLGDAFRQADIFVMPSQSEGVPKVTQEAAACGLAQVIFGYYEAPSVVDSQNGFVVWNDDDFFVRVGELVNHPRLISALGRTGADMARAWDWSVVAQKWQERLIEIAKHR
jgi:glycosyltransferase involved in cell wall biosynthesis